LGFAEQGASEKTISESSLKELRSLIERVGFLAVLYDLTFLSEYLRVRPQDRSELGAPAVHMR
jgi:hypothetical protein